MLSSLQNLHWPPVGWLSGEARRRIHFYFGAFRVPVLFVLGAVGLERSIHYGALPLGGYLAGRTDYYIARIEAARDDNADALQWIRASLLHSRTDAASWRLAAQISGRLDSPETTYCWQQLDRLSPGTLATRLRVAESALRYQQLDAAAEALREVAPAHPSTTAFLCAAGKLAMACGEKDDAQNCFSKIADTHPTDSATIFALAQWYATSGRPGDLNLARRLLIGLIVHPESVTEAYRLLAAVALETGNRNAALRWSDALQRSGHASFEDRVARLDLVQGPELDLALASLLASNQPDELAPVLGWMVAHGHSRQVLVWMHDQPQKIKHAPLIRGALADCLSSLRQWRALRDAQTRGNWADREHQRLMYLARAQFELGAESDARVAWSGAVFACHDYPDYLGLLTYLKQSKLDGSTQPFWLDARRQVWTKMISRYPNQAWIVHLLLSDAIARHDSLTIQNCWMQLAAIDPENIEAAAYGAQICLLRGVRVEKSSALLQELHAHHPENPVAANALAYDLFRQGRFGEALAIMGGLRAEDLNSQERAPYLGALLAAAGPVEQARAHLRLAAARADLLPEEVALIRSSLDLVSYREAMAAFVDSSSASLDSAGSAAYSAKAASIGESMLLRVCESARLARVNQTDQAARLLGGIDPTSLDPARLSIYLGGILNLTGQPAKALSYLELSSDLPFESGLEKMHQATEAWWSLSARGDDSAKLAGLFSVYRALDLYESDAAFWRHDEARETQLTRHALLCGYAPDAVQERLHGLLQHVPVNPDMQTQLAYALLLEGLPRAARERMEALAPADLAQPEASFYYGVILAMCGEKRTARSMLEHAEKSSLRLEEASLLQRAEKLL